MRTGTDPTRVASVGATLTVAGAAKRLGVHPNTVRTWTDQGRLRCLRINARGDRRYRIDDLDAFITHAGRESEYRVGAAEARLEAGAQPARRPNAQRDWPIPASRREAWAARSDAAVEVLTLELPAPQHPAPAVLPLPARADGAPSREAAAHRTKELRVLADIARMTTDVADLDATLRSVCRVIQAEFGYRTVTCYENRDGMAAPRAGDGPKVSHLRSLDADREPLAGAFRSGEPALVATWSAINSALAGVPGSGIAVIAPIVVGGTPWGLLLVTADGPAALSESDLPLLGAVANQVAAGVENERLLRRVRMQLHQASALRHISADISSKLDLSVILSDLVDHAQVLFGADRAAAFLIRDDGTVHPEVARNLSPAYLAFVRAVRSPSLGAEALATGVSVFAVDYANDPRGAGVRAAVIQEGFDTMAVSPLVADGRPVGLLVLYHDQRHPWAAADLDVLDALALQAGIALANAANYSRMAGWAAQLQSIQSLAARLNGLLTVRDIGMAMVSELDQLIDYHSIRVYRSDGDDLLPVAWRGNAGVYSDASDDGARLRGRIGRGIIGWVAEHRVLTYVPDAARDPRGLHIPGTPEIDESMLVAPMLYEGRCLGVIALSKLGIDTFSGDHERLLEIYASFAAQAMANADANEQLRRQSEALAHQLNGQRELLRVTESILSTLDPRAVLEEIADRLGTLVRVDNLAIDLHDKLAHVLRPILARGIHQEQYLGRPLPDDQGVCGWVVRHGVGQLVPDQLADPRVRPFDDIGPAPGSLIVVPLRGRQGITGVMTLERLGDNARFTDDEFELVQLFAGQASIALQNAEAHQEVELRAQTDALTGLRNHGTFHETLGRTIARGARFSVLMLDLDHFKAYNDRRGHQAGNLLLQRIATALDGACRDADTVYRYGGDEFALILPATEAAGAHAVATKVADAVRSAGGRRGSGVSVSVSIGIATYPADGRTREELLLAADRACYAAKRGGRDRIATAIEGQSLAGEFLPTAPTPVDEDADSA